MTGGRIEGDPVRAIHWTEAMWDLHCRVVKEWEPGSLEDVHFLLFALFGEVGEYVNLVKKEWRGDPVDHERIAEELADIAVYYSLLLRIHNLRSSDKTWSMKGKRTDVPEIRRKAAFALGGAAGALLHMTVAEIVPPPVQIPPQAVGGGGARRAVLGQFYNCLAAVCLAEGVNPDVAVPRILPKIMKRFPEAAPEWWKEREAARKDAPEA